MDTKRHEDRMELSLRFRARPEYLSLSRMAVRQAAQQIGLEETKAEAVVLAVVEALTNVIRHSYGGPCDQPIDFDINRWSEEETGRTGLEVVIRDYGPCVDLNCICGRNLDEIRPGGLGVHIIQSTMDEMEYRHATGGGLQLRIVKYL